MNICPSRIFLNICTLFFDFCEREMCIYPHLFYQNIAKNIAYFKHEHLAFSKISQMQICFAKNLHILNMHIFLFQKDAHFFTMFCEKKCACLKNVHIFLFFWRFFAKTNVHISNNNILQRTKKVYIYRKAVKFWRTTHIHTWIAPKGCLVPVGIC